MTAKEYVKSIYPDAYLEKDGADYWIWAILDSGNECIIGDGFSAEDAWEDAQQNVAEMQQKNDCG